MIETYEQWEARRTYSVYRNRRVQPNPKVLRLVTEETIVATGLKHQAARKMADELQAEWFAAHPGRTSWTADLFVIELETPWVPVHLQQQQQQQTGEGEKQLCLNF